MNLVDRYAEELHRSQHELAGIIDRIRVRKLGLAGQQAVSRMHKKSLRMLLLPYDHTMYSQTPLNTDTPVLQTVCFVPGERKNLNFF